MAAATCHPSGCRSTSLWPMAGELARMRTSMSSPRPSPTLDATTMPAVRSAFSTTSPRIWARTTLWTPSSSYAGRCAGSMTTATTGLKRSERPSRQTSRFMRSEPVAATSATVLVSTSPRRSSRTSREVPSAWTCRTWFRDCAGTGAALSAAGSSAGSGCTFCTRSASVSAEESSRTIDATSSSRVTRDLPVLPAPTMTMRSIMPAPVCAHGRRRPHQFARSQLAVVK